MLERKKRALSNNKIVMSDYGALIKVTKKDGSNISAVEKDSLSKIIGKIKNNEEFSDSLGEDFLFTFSELTGENNSLILTLSEYWHGEGDEEENFEFAEENDLSFAEEIAKILEKELGNTFTFEAKFENW